MQGNWKKNTSVYIVYVLFYLVTAVISLGKSNGEITGYNIGQMLGFWAITGLSLQPLLSSRWKILERGVGLNRLIRLHDFNARFLFLAALFHPVFLFFPFIRTLNDYFRVTNTYTVWHWTGIATLGFLALTIVTTLLPKVIKLKYEQ